MCMCIKTRLKIFPTPGCLLASLSDNQRCCGDSVPGARRAQAAQSASSMIWGREGQGHEPEGPDETLLPTLSASQFWGSQNILLCVGATMPNICFELLSVRKLLIGVSYLLFCNIPPPLNRAVHKNNHHWVCSWTCSLAGTACLPVHSVTLGHLKLGVTCWLGGWNTLKAHSCGWHLTLPEAGVLSWSVSQNTYTWLPHVAACLSQSGWLGFKD